MDFFDFRDPVSTWTHLIWMLLAVPGTVVLWQRSRGDRPKQIALAVFGLSTINCFGSSALFHGLHLTETQLHLYLMLDYVGIYVLIAGSCTPIIFTLIQGWWKWTLLGTIWLAALAGSASRIFELPMPPVLSTILYLVMGWGLFSCYPSLAKALSHRGLRLLVLGGVFYSLGALAYVTGWPAPWPGVVGAHEVLHLCDMAGSLSHFGFMIWYVAPFERLTPVPEVEEVPGSLAAEQGIG